MLMRLIAEQGEKERHNIRAPFIWLLALMMVQTTNFALAQQADDALPTTPATPEIIARGLEPDGYQLGLSSRQSGRGQILRHLALVPTESSNSRQRVAAAAAGSRPLKTVT